MKILLLLGMIPVAIVVVLLLVLIRPEAVRVPVEPPAMLVDVAVAKRQPVTFVVRSQGVVTPRTRTTLVSEVSGQIIEVSPAFVSGGFFERGDVLVRIDPRYYEAARKRASSGVAQARTRVATERALAEYAAKDWERLRGLDAAQGPASDLTLRKPQLAEALAGLDFAEADLEKASEDLERTVIRAPYDGMVREKRADVGQFVNPGTALAVTFATDYAEVRLPLPQKDLRYLDLPAPGAAAPLPVSLTADIAGASHAWEGRVVRSEGVFDTDSRVLHVVAQIDDPYRTAPGAGGEPLRIGTFVTATIAGRPGGELFVVPRHSLQRGRTLWLVADDMTIGPRDVAVVRADEEFAYVAGGLAEGDRYTIVPPERALPGTRVRLVPDGGDGGSTADAPAPPDVIATVPDVTGKVPDVTGKVPDVTGRVPDVVAAAPGGGDV